MLRRLVLHVCHILLLVNVLQFAYVVMALEADVPVYVAANTEEEDRLHVRVPNNSQLVIACTLGFVQRSMQQQH